jgi:hypothetical protein
VRQWGRRESAGTMRLSGYARRDDALIAERRTIKRQLQRRAGGCKFDAAGTSPWAAIFLDFSFFWSDFFAFIREYWCHVNGRSARDQGELTDDDGYDWQNCRFPRLALGSRATRTGSDQYTEQKSPERALARFGRTVRYYQER